MKKPSFTAALAQDQAPPPPEEKPTKVGDGRINTTFRVSPEGLEALKIVAAEKRTRVNDLLLEGAEHVLALHGRKMQLRK
jgi:hypothetical protein